MQEAVVDINGVATSIVTTGRWIEKSSDNEQEIIICITGNPGLTDFYKKFIATIHQKLETDTPVWVIGHAGHTNLPSTSIKAIPQLSGNEEKFNLKGQIKHKIDFIEKYVPNNVKIILIGHSIGAWMVLQLLKYPHIKDKVKKCFLLFPTIERMKESPNGKRASLILFSGLFMFILTIFNMLPYMLKSLILTPYFWFYNIPKYLIHTTLDLLYIPVMKQVIFLAKDELENVKNLEIDHIEKNKDLLKLYYGTTDGWVPVKYFKEIKNKVENINAVLDDKNICHSFVLCSAVEMGEMVAEWINNEK